MSKSIEAGTVEAVEPQGSSDAMEDAAFTLTPAEKTEALATAAKQLAAAAYVPMTFSTLSVLMHVMHSAGYQLKPLLSKVTAAGDDNILATHLYDEYSDEELELMEVDMARINGLQQLEQFAVCLIAHEFWQDPSDMRAALAKVSGRPKECVFAGDPEPAELWQVESVDRLGADGVQVDFLFAEEIPASCLIYLRPDGRDEIVFTKYPEGRATFLPGQRLGNLLFRRAFDAMDAAFPQNCVMDEGGYEYVAALTAAQSSGVFSCQFSLPQGVQGISAHPRNLEEQ